MFEIIAKNSPQNINIEHYHRDYNNIKNMAPESKLI
jgi:hypothetical protein